MARFLFVVPPLTGHINPTLSVGHLLAERGHDVAWAGHASRLRDLLRPTDRLFALDERISGEDLAALGEKSTTLRGLAAMKFLWEDVLVPLGRAMQPGVRQAVRDFAPDVIVADQQALAGAIVARQSGRPWATFTTSAAGLIEMPLPLVWDWVLTQLSDLQREAGLPTVVARPDISEHLMVVFTTVALAGEADYPARYRFVGPSITDRGQDTPFPWESLAHGKRLLVSLGTVNAERGADFYRKLVEALAAEPVQVILSAPRALLPPLPDHFLARDYVPQLALLPHVDAVVCHAGQNTGSEALAHGRPLVVTPIKDDQGLIATQVVNAGAGLRVRWGRLRAADLGAAIRRVLSEPAFAEGAARVRQSFVDAGGAPRAADLLEELL
jgi:UDP:flavonoid glycosyltransferase YjiC (YdhE family)